LDEIFDAFQANGIANANELTDALRYSGIAGNCNVIIDKINDWVSQKGPQVNEIQFKNFFRFNLEDDRDFKYIFRLLDDQRGVQAGIRELTNANRKFELGLTQDDIRLMIDNLRGSGSENVSRQELFKILYQTGLTK